MADVQIDDGNFTRIANVLLEKISAAKLNGCQHAIILYVWRYTYGFKRKDHDLSAGFLAKGTGYNKRQVEREVSALVARHILLQRVINGVSRNLSFNKDFETWVTPGELADGEKADGEYTDGVLADTPPANKPTVTPGELADQERKSFKENSKEIINKEYVPFTEIITHLNEKAGTSFRASTKATKEHISARWREKYTLDDFKKVIDNKCAEWLGSDMEKYLTPDTLFSPSKFDKYLNQKAGGGNSGSRGRFNAGHEEANRRAADQDADLFFGTPG